jgi:hypothetical protein
MAQPPPYSGPTAKVQVRIPQEWRTQLEQEANKLGMDFNQYIRQNLNDLVLKGHVIIDKDSRMNIPVPWGPYGAPGVPQAPYQQYPAGYPATGYAPAPPMDALDHYVNQMSKMAIAQMFSDMIKGRTSPQEMMALAQQAKTGSRGDDGFNMKDMMQYQMMQAQLDREMARSQAQLEMARGKGDKSGEKSILDYITALTTVGANQTAQFMQQLMLMSQQNSQAQTNMFQTALTGKGQADAASIAERDRHDERIEKIRADLQGIQMKGIEYLRGIYAASGLSIKPKTRVTKIDALKEIIRAWGLNPEEILTRDALTRPNATVIGREKLEENQLHQLSIALKQQLLKEMRDEQNGNRTSQ